MKKLILALIVSAGFGIASVQAQDDAYVKEENYEVESSSDGSYESSQSSVYEKDGYTYEESTSTKVTPMDSDPEGRTRAGKALNKAGHAGKEEGGKAVKRGASWTWDKTKHNKVTKNVFNQPGDNDD